MKRQKNDTADAKVICETVHAINAERQATTRRKLRRGELLDFFAALPPCLVGMDACASADHWTRELQDLGHEVRLMPPAYGKSYMKRGKTDAADAEAICEAVMRPTVRFVAVKRRLSAVQRKTI